MDLYSHTNLREVIPSHEAQTSGATPYSSALLDLTQHGTDPQWIRDQIAKAEARDAKEIAG